MSEELVNLEINGVPVKARKGSMLIQAADAYGIYIPRFCYHEKLSVAANCRMCLVEVEKAPKPLPACATPVGEGMKVMTQSQRALSAQKATMEFLLINHPLDCPICDQGGECELQDLALGYGKDVSRYQERKRVVADKNIGPLISTDMTRCIHCTRCVRFGSEIAGIQELGGIGRGENMEIAVFVGRCVDHELSGNVIDLCPVGALNSKPFRMRARAWELTSVPTIAPHDCLGSNVYAHVLRGRVMRVVPNQNDALNETWISDRDRFSYDGIYSDDRLHKPMLKSNGAWREVEWGVALEAAADALRAGGSELNVLVSPNATLEEQYLLQKLARGLGSDNIDHRLTQTDFRADEYAPAFPSLGLSVAEFEKLDAGLIVGSNVRKDVPMLGHRLRKAALRGARLTFVNPRHYALLFDAAQLTSGMLRDLVGIAKALEKLAGKRAPKHLHKLLDPLTPNEAQQTAAEQLFNGTKTGVVLGPLAMHDGEYSALQSLAAAVAELAGAVFGYITPGANAAGAWLAGAVPHRLPGGKPAQGRNARDMLEQPGKTYVLFGVEPERDCAFPARALQTLAGAEHVVAFTPYATDAMRDYATVLLPTGAFGETSGTYVNGAGEWQTFTGAAMPVGEARPGWKVLRVLGNLLNLDGFEQRESTDVRDEAARVIGEIKPDNRYTGKVEIAGEKKRQGFTRLTEIPLYAADALVRRAASLQKTNDAREAAAVVLNPADAGKLGLQQGDAATLVQDGATVVLPVRLDASLASGHAVVPAGIEQTAGFGAFSGVLEIGKA